MAESLRDYCRRAIKEQLSVRFATPNVDLRSERMRVLDKHREIKLMDELLNLERERFEVKKEILGQRDEDLRKKEETHKEAKLRFHKMNDAKQAALMKKIIRERTEANEQEQNLQQLKSEKATLLLQKEKLQTRVARYGIFPGFLQSVVEKSEQFHNLKQLVDRFEAMLLTREHLLERRSMIESARVQESSDLRSYISEQRFQLLQYKNNLSSLQSDLEYAEVESFRSESKWNHILSTATKNTRLLGQIRFVTVNLYHMTGEVIGHRKCPSLSDSVQQLNRIQRYVVDQKDVLRYLESGVQR